MKTTLKNNKHVHKSLKSNTNKFGYTTDNLEKSCFNPCQFHKLMVQNIKFYFNAAFLFNKKSYLNNPLIFMLFVTKY